MSEDNLDYYRRRAAEELAAAQRAPSAAIAEVHRSLAERYMVLAGEPQALVPPQLRAAATRT